MEKYAKLLKGLEVCGGPECGIQCPYHGETRGGMTCRARLLADAAIAINNEQALHESAEEGLRNAVEKLGELDSINTTICAEREKLREELATVNNGYRMMTNEMADLQAIVRAKDEDVRHYLDERNALSRECTALTVENKTLHERCQVQQNEINALLLKVGKTDRTSEFDDALKNEYKRGYLDAMEYCFRELCKRAGGGCCHE